MSYYHCSQCINQEEEFLPPALYTQTQYSNDSHFIEMYSKPWEQDMNSTANSYEFYPQIAAYGSYEAPCFYNEMPLSPYSLDDWSCRSVPENIQKIETENTNETGRRSLTKLLKSEYKFKQSKYLIFFTYTALNDPNNQDIIWRDESKGKFFIRNPKEFSRDWGQYKGKGKMDYSKVARSLRYYYKDGLLSKSEGLREYVWDPLVLDSLKQRFKLGRDKITSSSSN
ncbi:E-twenty-six (ETS) transcription factor [Oopsacas minuta]|uniref:E-twenty-six (ETS) transcription factor n=1 Tax=Oopsacas minuta TaxID=111878 RepID=A0AAV7JI80_9METZ|nr:E-twenty-six (ETS) transcription factor [Oopsacas minuta]